MAVQNVLKVTNPYSGEQIGELPVSSKEEVAHAVARAREAFQAFRSRTAFDRYTILMNVAEKILEHGDRLARILTDEIWKPIKESGIGREGIKYIVREMCELKTVVM